VQANWVSGKRGCTASELAEQGIVVGHAAATELDSVTARLKAEHKAPREEPLILRRGDPHLEGEGAKEADEHAHFGEEIRLVLEGTGAYEIRDAKDDQVIEIKLVAGDWIVIPPERYHRFLLDGAMVHCRQLFAELRTLMPFYRASHDETRTV
jgi:1,2-dihydroxy-3-keto-5-methylthiopentene dioxygenase